MTGSAGDQDIIKKVNIFGGFLRHRDNVSQISMSPVPERERSFREIIKTSKRPFEGMCVKSTSPSLPWELPIGKTTSPTLFGSDMYLGRRAILVFGIDEMHRCLLSRPC